MKPRKSTWAELSASRELWDRRFIQLAYCVRGWSKDDRPVGAVLVDKDRRVIGTGYNGFPAGINDSEERLLDKQLKRNLMIHAELNCVLNSVSDTAGSTLYITRFPCHECAKIVIQKGIERVASAPPEFDHESWGWSHKLASSMLKEAGIEWTQRL